MRNIISLAFCFLASCAAPIDSHTCDGGTGGTSGAGGSVSSSGGTGGSGGMPCAPGSPFAGSDVCSWPDIVCCDLQGADIVGHCYAAFEGKLNQAVLCSEAPGPSPGPSTDYFTCKPLTITALSCAWGDVSLWCCENLPGDDG